LIENNKDFYPLPRLGEWMHFKRLGIYSLSEKVNNQGGNVPALRITELLGGAVAHRREVLELAKALGCEPEHILAGQSQQRVLNERR
jgi:hypothetical protein